MNKKGSYAGAIALIAVLVIVVATLGSRSSATIGAQKNYAEAIVDTKSAWQNARDLLDKSFSDALADASSQACAIDASLVDSYLNATLQDAGDLNCTVLNIGETQVSGDQATVTAEFSCGMSMDKAFVKYGKIAWLKKFVYVLGAGPPCNVDVKDMGSLVCEVDTIVGNPTECGN
jgi:hypothetical protein